MINDFLPTPLVTAEWLLKHREQVLLLDCRFSLTDDQAGIEAYRAGHVPGAIYADLTQHLSSIAQESGTGGRHPAPEPEVLAQWLGSIGVSNKTLVVAYDDPQSEQGFYAARAWWLLRWLGHTEVAVLDGGLGAYLAAGGDLTRNEPKITAKIFIANVQSDMLVTAADVVARNEDVVLIDSRSPERFRGENELIDKKAGHIPGAVNLSWIAGLDAQGYFLPPQQQRERLDLADNVPSIMYCGSGVSATPNLLARELMGVPLGKNNQLYLGSWSDWVSDDTRPIAIGDE